MPAFNADNLAKNLPDTFRQDEKSNNYLLLKLASNSVERGEAALAEIREARDVSTATGISLDILGAAFGAERRARTDEAYRIIIQAEIAKTLCMGEYGDIRRCLAMLLQCEESEIVIHDRIGAVGIREMRVPLAGFLRAGLTDAEILAVLDDMLPGGVGMERAVLSGDFTYTSAGHEAEDSADIKSKGYDDGAYSGYLNYGG